MLSVLRFACFLRGSYTALLFILSSFVAPPATPHFSTPHILNRIGFTTKIRWITFILPSDLRVYSIDVFPRTGKSAVCGTTKERQRRPQCSKCPRRLKTSYHLEQHERRHDLMVYKCRLCSAMFEKTNHLKSHYYYFHSVKADGIVNVSASRNVKRLKRGRATRGRPTTVFKTKVPLKKLKCTFCKRRFRNLRNRKIHEAEHDRMRYKCRDGCGYMFATIEELDWHYRNNHGFRIRKLQSEMYRIQPVGLKGLDKESGSSVPQGHPCPHAGCEFLAHLMSSIRCAIGVES